MLPLQLVKFVTQGGRLAIPEREALPGPDSAAFGGLDDYVALIQACWQQNPEERPSFAAIVEVLR